MRSGDRRWGGGGGRRSVNWWGGGGGRRSVNYIWEEKDFCYEPFSYLYEVY